MLPSDTIFTIYIDDIKEIEIFDTGSLSLFLTAAEDKKVAVFTSGTFGAGNSVHGLIVDEKINNVGSSTTIRKFKPELDVTYVYINVTNVGFNQSMSNSAYAFRFKMRDV